MSKRIGSSERDLGRPGHLGGIQAGNEQRAGHFNFSLPGANGDDYETKAEQALSSHNEIEHAEPGSPAQAENLGRAQSPFYQSSEQDHGANRFEDQPITRFSVKVFAGNEAGEE